MSNRRVFLATGAASLLLLVAGCASTAPLTYDLARTQVEPVRRSSSRTVVITMPKAVQTYDSERVVVREAGGILSYLPEAQWADRLPRLVQTRVLQAFEDARFPNIGRPDDQLAVDVTLATELRAFEIDVSQEPMAVVSIAAKLVDERQRSIFASQVFTASVPASADNGVAAITALNAALRDVTAQIINWAATRA